MRIASLSLGIFVLLSALPALAQDANAQKSLQKAQYMLRQVSSEKVELQVQVDALKQEIEKLTRDLSDTKIAADSNKKKMEAMYGGAIEQWKQRDAQTSDLLAATKQQLASQTEQRRMIEAQLQKQSQNFSICYENNKKLYDINAQLLGHYEHKGFADVVKQREPFTGMKQVEIESLVEDYRYQLDGLKLPDQSVAAGKDEAEH
jgi:chromosome segregation ATPase